MKYDFSLKFLYGIMAGAAIVVFIASLVMPDMPKPLTKEYKEKLENLTGKTFKVLNYHDLEDGGEFYLWSFGYNNVSNGDRIWRYDIDVISEHEIYMYFPGTDYLVYYEENGMQLHQINTDGPRTCYFLELQ